MVNSKMLAKLRQREIARKSRAQSLTMSGNVEGAHAQLTEINRLIKCDHYKRTGNNAKIAHQRDAIAKLRKEIKANKEQVFRHVKRDNGKTLAVKELIKK